jgi:hypothetical protein
LSETAAETGNTYQEEASKSFDVLASVKLYQHDLENAGYILPETRQRVYDEELSYIAEGINLPNYTEFVLNEHDGDLVYFHEGKWVPYTSTLIKGLETAKVEAATDYRKNFELQRRAEDLQRGYQLQKLQPGERISWYYEFPREQTNLYGEEFMESLGFYPERAMGYLCEAEKTKDGQVILRHQSVDNSDKIAFDEAISAARSGGTIEDMTMAYDEVLKQKSGIDHYAGRRIDENRPEENAWSAFVKHEDLVKHFLDQIEVIARQELPSWEAEKTKKRLTYGVWARLKERLDEQAIGITSDGPEHSAYGGSIQSQVESAYASAAARGEVLFGCGGSITGENATLSASPKAVFESIFGKKMSCPFCGATQYGDPCSSNQLCSECTAEVKNGRVVSRGGGRAIKKGFLDILSDELNEWNQRYDYKQEEKRARQLASEETEKIKGGGLA